ncbi:hypothetical protein M2T82_14005 [Elizabethkingia ursingii]|uniref:hypothetical protein n=1 Tax=Elizabethkingia ursingii TaxID=1756150 RepID=UPI0020126612|nr:hypothetical protein [Elizabethkingia ursingii]MCL1669180.1 hypothetical protein [Elizabethkingia ursingii]
MHHKNNVKQQQEKLAIIQKKLDASVKDGLLVGFNLYGKVLQTKTYSKTVDALGYPLFSLNKRKTTYTKRGNSKELPPDI